MKSLKLFKRSRVLLLYRYFLLEGNDKEFEKFLDLYSTVNESEDKISNDLVWFNNFKIQKEIILEKINSNLKEDWEISRIPAFEKAILSDAIYEMKYSSLNNEKAFFLIINQAIEFSKKYLDFEKFKYINKILDIVAKEEIKNTVI